MESRLTAFKTGETVQLKSGGPIMTVEGTSKYGVLASWFAYGQCRRQRFVRHSIQRAQAPQAHPPGAAPSDLLSPTAAGAPDPAARLDPTPA